MTIQRSGLSKKHTKYVGELTKSLHDGLESIRQSMDAAREPFSNLDTVVNRLTELKKDDVVDKAMNFNKAVASDIDEYAVKMKDIENEIQTLATSLPEKGRHVGVFSMKAFAVGQEILQLNEKIISTTIAVADDYVKLLKDAGLE